MSNPFKQLLTSWPLLSIATLLLLGIALGSVVGSQIVGVSVIGVFLLSLCALGAHFFKARFLDWLLIYMFLIVAGVLYSGIIDLYRLQMAIPDRFDNLQATVVSEPQRTLYGFSGYLNLEFGGSKQKVYASWPESVSINYGDIMIVSGEVRPLQNRSFAGYLKAHGVRQSLLLDTIELTETQSSDLGINFFRALYDLRDRILAAINTTFEAPESALISGMILGSKDDLPPKIEKDFQKVGLSHILVASGSNVLMLVWIIQSLLGGIGFRFSRIMIVTILLGFIVITGADPSIIRATIFYFFILTGQLLGRPIHAPTTIAFVALLMALVNPWIILYDISFQLSFAAVLGLLLYSDWLASHIRVPILKDYLAPTLAAVITTTPFILYYFGTVSLIAPLANLLILPLVPLVMGSSSLAIALPWLKALIWATQGIVTSLLSLVEWLATLPWAQITVPNNQIFLIAFWMILLIALYYLRKKTVRITDVH